MQPLRGASQFQNVFSQPDVRQHAKDVLLLVKKNDRPEHRIGLITSKKKLRRAVDRNRFRRVARSVVRADTGLTGLDVIWMVKQAPISLHDSDLFHELTQQLNKALLKLS